MTLTDKRFHPDPAVNRYAVVLKALADIFSQGLAQPAQERGGKRLHHRHLQPQLPRARGDFHPNEARPDHNEPPGFGQVRLQGTSIVETTQSM